MSDANLDYLREFFSADSWLLDVFGHPVQTDNFVFVPCAASFPHGKAHFKSASIELADHTELLSCVSENGDFCDYEEATLLWLRGRLAAIFGIQPPLGQEQIDFFQIAFVVAHRNVEPVRIHMMAVIGGSIDDYGGFDLDFAIHSDRQIDTDIRDDASNEFVELLLHDSTNVRDYFDYIADGTYITLVEFSQRGTELTPLSGILISDNFGEEVFELQDSFDLQLGYGYFSTRECLDCQGCGEEYTVYPLRQTCENCGGKGRVHW